MRRHLQLCAVRLKGLTSHVDAFGRKCRLTAGMTKQEMQSGADQGTWAVWMGAAFTAPFVSELLPQPRRLLWSATQRSRRRGTDLSSADPRLPCLRRF